MTRPQKHPIGGISWPTVSASEKERLRSFSLNSCAGAVWGRFCQSNLSLIEVHVLLCSERMVRHYVQVTVFEGGSFLKSGISRIVF